MFREKLIALNFVQTCGKSGAKGTDLFRVGAGVGGWREGEKGGSCVAGKRVKIIDLYIDDVVICLAFVLYNLFLFRRLHLKRYFGMVSLLLPKFSFRLRICFPVLF